MMASHSMNKLIERYIYLFVFQARWWIAKLKTFILENTKHAHTQRVFIYYIVSNVQRIVQVTVKYDLIYTKLRDGVSTQPNTIRDDIQANTKYTFWVSQL